MSMIIDGIIALRFFGRSIVMVAMPFFFSYRIRSFFDAMFTRASPIDVQLSLFAALALRFSRPDGFPAAHLVKLIHLVLRLMARETGVMALRGNSECLVEARLRRFAHQLLV